MRARRRDASHTRCESARSIKRSSSRRNLRRKMRRPSWWFARRSR